MDKIFKQLYPGVKEEYLERAFEKLKKNGCPADEDLMVWFGKLVAAEILEDALGNGKRIARNIYADSEEECEIKLEALIKEMKAELEIR